MLKAESVTLSYTDGDRITNAVEDVSLEIPSRGFFGIMGPSGSGKSSLLYLMSGLKRPTNGQINVEGRPIGTLPESQRAQIRRERFGFVFQQPFLLNYLTARENILSAARTRDNSAQSRTQNLLETLAIAHLANDRPYELSGGERQRVCVARAMSNDPAVIFADEPTASLDHANGHLVMELLTSYRDRGVVIVVTHDAEMLSGADRVVNMRDGRIVDDEEKVSV